MTVRQTPDTAPAEPIAADKLLGAADRTLRFEKRISDTWTAFEAAPLGDERDALRELAWRLEDISDHPALLALAIDDDLARDLWMDRHAGLEPVDRADLFNDRADAAAGKEVAS